VHKLRWYNSEMEQDKWSLLNDFNTAVNNIESTAANTLANLGRDFSSVVSDKRLSEAIPIFILGGVFTAVHVLEKRLRTRGNKNEDITLFVQGESTDPDESVKDQEWFKYLKQGVENGRFKTEEALGEQTPIPAEFFSQPQVPFTNSSIPQTPPETTYKGSSSQTSATALMERPDPDKKAHAENRKDIGRIISEAKQNAEYVAMSNRQVKDDERLINGIDPNTAFIFWQKDGSVSVIFFITDPNSLQPKQHRLVTYPTVEEYKEGMQKANFMLPQKHSRDIFRYYLEDTENQWD